MAFPQRAASLATLQGSNTGSWTVNIPAHDSGDVLLFAGSVDGNPNLSLGAVNGVAWTRTVHVDRNSAVRLGVWWLRATSNQATDTTVTLTSDQLQMGATRCFRITDADSSTAPEFATAATGTSDAPDPPSLDPSVWGAEDTLWGVIVGTDVETITVDAYPTNYSSGTSDRGGAFNAGAGLHIAWRELNASSDDPAAFDMSASEDWVAATIAFRPVAGLTEVSKTVEARWHVRTAVSKTQQTRWNVDGAVTKTFQTRWDVDGEVTATVSIAWNVAVQTGPAPQIGGWSVKVIRGPASGVHGTLVAAFTRNVTADFTEELNAPGHAKFTIGLSTTGVNTVEQGHEAILYEGRHARFWGVVTGDSTVDLSAGTVTFDLVGLEWWLTSQKVGDEDNRQFLVNRGFEAQDVGDQASVSSWTTAGDGFERIQILQELGQKYVRLKQTETVLDRLRPIARTGWGFSGDHLRYKDISLPEGYPGPTHGDVILNGTTALPWVEFGSGGLDTNKYSSVRRSGDTWRIFLYDRNPGSLTSIELELWRWKQGYLRQTLSLPKGNRKYVLTARMRVPDGGWVRQSGSGTTLQLRLFRSGTQIGVVASVPLNDDTPRDRWMNVEVARWFPAGSATSREATVRLVCPVGLVDYDMTSLEIREVLLWEPTDVATAARALISHVQDTLTSPAHSDLKITVPSGATVDVEWPRRYPFDELADVGEELADMTEHIDWWVTWNDSTLSRTFQVAEARGDYRYDVVLTNTTCEVEQVAERGSHTRNTWLVTAKSDTPGRPAGWATASGWDGAKLWGIAQGPRGAHTKQLKARAEKLTARRAVKADIPVLTSTVERLGGRPSLGDRFRARLDTDRVFIDGWLRVHKLTWGSGGTVTMECNRTTAP